MRERSSGKRDARAHRSKRAGFTLLELMVALFAGSLVIASLYYVGVGSTQQFQQQERVSQLQTSLQLAMEQIKRDVLRAGLFASPNAQLARPAFCPVTGNVMALQHQDNPDGAIVDPTGAHGVEADVLTLVGNFLTADEYYASSAVNGTIRLQRGHQSYRRSFELWWDGSSPPFTPDQARLTDVFRANRWLRIRRTDGDGFEFYVFIAGGGVNGSGVTVIPPAQPLNRDLSIGYVTPNGGALPEGSPCMPDICLGCRIAPLSEIRYLVVNAAGETAQQPGSAEVTGPVTQLIRREMDPVVGGGAALAGIPDRVVLENVVEFDVRFVIAVGPNNTNLQEVQVLLPAQVFAVRSVVVTLSARTLEQDPRFPWQPRNGGPLTRFRFSADRPGAARVRTLRAEIPVENIAMQRPPVI